MILTKQLDFSTNEFNETLEYANFQIYCALDDELNGDDRQSLGLGIEMLKHANHFNNLLQNPIFPKEIRYEAVGFAAEKLGGFLRDKFSKHANHHKAAHNAMLLTAELVDVAYQGIVKDNSPQPIAA